MKEFNLEQARQGKPVCTRDGRNVRILCFDRKDKYYHIIALVERNNQESSYLLDDNGRCHWEGEEDEWDLFMKPEKHTGYINLYKNEGKYRVDSYVCESKKEVLACAINDCIDTLKIEWEDINLNWNEKILQLLCCYMNIFMYLCTIIKDHLTLVFNKEIWSALHWLR